MFHNYSLYRMDPKHTDRTTTGDCTEAGDDISSGTSMSSLPQEKTNMSGKNVSGANLATALKPTAER